MSLNRLPLTALTDTVYATISFSASLSISLMKTEGQQSCYDMSSPVTGKVMPFTAKDGECELFMERLAC